MNKTNLTQVGLVGLYLCAIVSANLLVVQFGPTVTIINAFLFIGLDITVRDYLHESWRGRGLWPRMLALIAAGSFLSWWFNRAAGPVALASLVAFLGSGLIDALAYTFLHRYSRALKINGSNVISAATDSILFPLFAFGWPLLWWVVIGQFIAKTAGGFVWYVVLNFKMWRREYERI